MHLIFLLHPEPVHVSRQYHSEVALNSRMGWLLAPEPIYNNGNDIYLLQFGCYPVAVVILHVYKT